MTAPTEIATPTRLRARARLGGRVLVSGVRYPEVEVELTGENGNPFAIIVRVISGLRRADVPEEVRDEFRREATSGDYMHLLQTCMCWVNCA